MTWTPPGDDSYEFQDGEGPEAKFSREDMVRQNTAERLIRSLGPWDSHRVLFTFKEQQFYRITRLRRPA